MSSVNCNVVNCSYNDSGMCYANKIAVNGKKSHTSTHTCCSSFVDSGGDLSSSNNERPCSFIGCNVKTCSHNASTVCALNNIAITSQAPRPNASSETYCSSFDCK